MGRQETRAERSIEFATSTYARMSNDPFVTRPGYLTKKVCCQDFAKTAPAKARENCDRIDVDRRKTLESSDVFCGLVNISEGVRDGRPVGLTDELPRAPIVQPHAFGGL